MPLPHPGSTFASLQLRCIIGTLLLDICSVLAFHISFEHVITGNLNIISIDNFRDIMMENIKYRIELPETFLEVFDDLSITLESLIQKVAHKSHLSVALFDDFKHYLLVLVY